MRGIISKNYFKLRIFLLITLALVMIPATVFMLMEEIYAIPPILWLSVAIYSIRLATLYKKEKINKYDGM